MGCGAVNPTDGGLWRGTVPVQFVQPGRGTGGVEATAASLAIPVVMIVKRRCRGVDLEANAATFMWAEAPQPVALVGLAPREGRRTSR